MFFAMSPAIGWNWAAQILIGKVPSGSEAATKSANCSASAPGPLKRLGFSQHRPLLDDERQVVLQVSHGL